MTHAVAGVVLVEQFRVFPSAGGNVGLECPDDSCPILLGDPYSALGELLAAARGHVLEHHPYGDRLDHERAYTTVVHAVRTRRSSPSCSYRSSDPGGRR
jgi:hypothetical protein